MDRRLICQICGEKLPFDPICTCTLGEHLLKNHPDAEMTHFVLDDPSLCECDRESGSGLSEESTRDIGVGNNYNKPVFKTTIETWKPGPLKVVCPLCGKEDRPCIRKQRNKVASTQLGAMCMVTCWPICFLPCLMPQSSAIHLYCRHCGALLGEYNRNTGTLKPAPADPMFLKLLHREMYTGHCFRRTIATLLVNSGGDILQLKRLGRWKSSTVAEGYVGKSTDSQVKIATKISGEFRYLQW